MELTKYLALLLCDTACFCNKLRDLLFSTFYEIKTSFTFALSSWIFVVNHDFVSNPTASKLMNLFQIPLKSLYWLENWTSLFLILLVSGLIFGSFNISFFPYGFSSAIYVLSFIIFSSLISPPSNILKFIIKDPSLFTLCWGRFKVAYCWVKNWRCLLCLCRLYIFLSCLLSFIV